MLTVTYKRINFIEAFWQKRRQPYKIIVLSLEVHKICLTPKIPVLSWYLFMIPMISLILKILKQSPIIMATAFWNNCILQWCLNAWMIPKSKGCKWLPQSAGVNITLMCWEMWCSSEEQHTDKWKVSFCDFQHLAFSLVVWGNLKNSGVACLGFQTLVAKKSSVC